MFKLKLFGTPQLEGPRGVVPQPGPRRLALLASLAAAGPAGLTRDKVVARLWPEADVDRARRNLSQVLYAMRNELGADLVEGTRTLRIDPAQCLSDVAAFDAAVAEHREQDAVDLYTGSFLDGFRLSDSRAFAEWADAERDRRAATARAAATLVEESVAAGDLASTLSSRHRAVAPLPASAMVHADTMTSTAPTASGTTDAPSPRPGRRYFAIGAISFVVVLAAVIWSQRAPAALRDGEFVLLAEFTNRTGDTLLSRTVGTAVAAALQQSAHVVPLPRGRVTNALRRMERPDTTERLDVELARDVAQREGVRIVLAGDLIESGGERELISRIIEAASGRILATRRFRVGAEDDLLSAVDRLAATMRRDLGEASFRVADAVPLPDVATASLAALHHYAAGLDAARGDNDELAAELYQRAVTLDSNFASAHAQLGTFYNANNDVSKASYHFRRALAQVDRLSIDEGLRIRISAAYARGDLEEAVSLSQRYLALRPRDAGAWARVGFYLYASGQGAAARAAYAAADSLSPISAGSVMNVGNSWFAEARQPNARALFDSARVSYERAIAMQPSLEFSAFYNHQYGSILLGAGRPDSARATFERMSARGPLDRARGLRSLAFLEATEGRWRSASAHFEEAAEIAVTRSEWTSAMRNDALQADLLLSVGDRSSAAAPLRRATLIALREPIETRAVAFIALAQLKAGDGDAADRLLARMRASARPEHNAEQAAILTVEGAMHLASGRVAEARRALRSAVTREASSLQTNFLFARALGAGGDDRAAAELWERIVSRFDFGVEGQFDWQFAPYELARVLERLGRTERAIETYRRLVAAFPAGDSEFQPPLLLDARDRLLRLETGGR